jgi:hypothetical protein
MKRLAVPLLSLALAAPAAAEQLEVLHKHRLVHAPGVTASVFSAPVRDARLKVVAVAQLPVAESERMIRVTVRDAANMASAKAGAIQRVRGASQVLVNGGFSGSQPDRPVGLLISGGRTVSIPNYERLPAQADSKCPFLKEARYRFSGLVCARADGALEVGLFGEKAIAGCAEALQAGPVLVEEGKGVALCEPERGEVIAMRTAVCKARVNGRELLRVVVTEQPLSLHKLAQSLAESPDKGGLGCFTAVNLSGADSSAAAYFAPGQHSRGASRIVGEGTFPQASLLSISAR